MFIMVSWLMLLYYKVAAILNYTDLLYNYYNNDII